MRVFNVLAVCAVSLTLAACGGGDDGGGTVTDDTSSSQQPVGGSGQGIGTDTSVDFSTPEAAVETFLRAARARDAAVLKECIADTATGDFDTIRDGTVTPEELDDLAQASEGATVTGANIDGDVATVDVSPFDGRDEEITLRKTDAGWKVEDF